MTLLTVAANALITYFLLRRQEDRYSKSMEKFRANLQYSNFEQQTKFSDIYPKRVKTLEDLYQIFSRLTNGLYILSVHTKGRMKSKEKREYEEHKSLIDSLMEDLYDFTQFYQNNRLFLSEQENDVMLDTFLTLIPIQTVITYIAGDPEMTSVPDMWVDRLLSANHKVKFKDLDPEEPEILLDELIKELFRLKGDLENLYKSVAEAKSN